MTYNLTTAFPPTILNQESKFYLSIYMPTHRTAPENEQDPIRFKNIIKELESKGLDEKHLKRLRSLENDQDFWIYNLEGLAILMNQDNMEIYRLPRAFKEHIYLGERFYLKPLIRNFQSDDRYYALGLTRKSFRLYSGNRYGFEEVEIDDEDRLLKNVLGDVKEGGSVNVVSQGKAGGNYHGHGARSEEIKVDTKRFFNYVDDYVADNYTNKYKIPLILIALPEHQSTFRQNSQNQYLLDKGVEKSPDSIKPNELKESLWNALEPLYLEKTENLLTRYHEGLSNDTSTHTLQDIVKAMVQERIQTLVIQDGKHISGTINLEQVTFKLHDEGEDILNHLAQLALERNMEVVILPEERMPKHHAVFAIYRY